MLSKEVCRKCWKEFFVQTLGSQISYWSEGDEMRWRDGKIHCPFYKEDPKYDGNWENVILYPTSKIPAICHSKFEQSVAMGMKHA